MVFDISLSLTLLMIMMAILFLYTKYEGRIRSLLGGKELRLREVVLLVAIMGTMVTILVFIPGMAILMFFLGVYSLVLFLFAYLVVPKWYLAILPPALFVALYLFYWNLILLNLFAAVFAIFVSVYLGSLFTWKTTAAFATLLTIMDVVQVFLTGFMVESAKKMQVLLLPIMIILPTFPSEGQIGLGLGDIFLFGLLVIQTAQKYGRKFGLATITLITIVFLLLETILLNFAFRYYPATVLIICGWLTALGAKYLYKLFFRTPKTV